MNRRVLSQRTREQILPSSVGEVQIYPIQYRFQDDPKLGTFISSHKSVVPGVEKEYDIYRKVGYVVYTVDPISKETDMSIVVSFPTYAGARESVEGMIKKAQKGSKYEKGMTTVKRGNLGKGIESNSWVEKIKNEIIKSGKVKPIEITPNGIIVDGEHRYKALMDIGVDDIPVFVGEQLGSSGILKERYQGLRVDIKLPTGGFSKNKPLDRFASKEIDGIKVLYARTDEEITQGLIGVDKEDFPENTVLVFNVRQGTFHMKGVKFPIDIAFIGKEGKVLKVESMEPELSYVSAPRGTEQVIEANENWFKGRGLREGNTVSFVESSKKGQEVAFDPVMFVKQLSPNTKVKVSKTGNQVTLTGEEGAVATIWKGVGDGIIRLKYGIVIDEMSSMKSGVEGGLRFVDPEYNEKRFKEEVEGLTDEPESELD